MRPDSRLVIFQRILERIIKKKLELFCFDGFGSDKLRKHPQNPYLIESYDNGLLLEHLVDAQLPIGAAGALAELATQA